MTRLLLLIGALIGSANAGPVTWYLHGVHYNNVSATGYSAGQFTYDADLNVLTDWSILDLGPSSEFPSSWSFPGVGNDGLFINSSFIILSGLDSFPGSLGHINHLYLVLAQPLTDAGGSVALVPFDPLSPTANSLETYHRSIIGQGFRYVDDGFVSTDGPTTVPEISTLSGVFFTLLCVGVWRGRVSWHSRCEQR